MTQPYKRKEQIGDAALYLGDSLEILPTLPKVDVVVTDPLSVLNFHVARLAQADQVAQIVGLFCAIKHTVRLNMMDRDRFTNDFSAFLACSAVSFHCDSSRFKPAPPPVSSWPAHPLRGPLAGKMLSHICGVAWLRAEATPGIGWILPFNPRLQLKLRSALRTLVERALNKIDRFCFLARECVGRPQPLSPLISDLVIIRHFSVSHVPFAAADLAAKPSRFRAVWLHLKRAAAYFTCLLNHAQIITHFMGSGTTGVACANLGRKFIGIEICESYFNTACERIAAAYAQGRLFQ